jgi:septal ring factor EnvC (AmiA/AmiB activator)
MRFRWRTFPRWPTATAVAVLGALGGLAALPIASNADKLGRLNSALSQQQAHQQQLQSSLGGLTQLIGSLSGQIALVQSREATVQAELAQDRSRLAAAQSELTRERRLVTLLRARLAGARRLLARQLLSSYESDNPDLVSVVLESHGFRDLLERITYLRDAEHEQQAVIAITRSAKAQADAATTRLTALQAADLRMSQDTGLRVQALAGMNSLLSSKQATLRRAQSIQQAALSASQSRAGQLQSEISQIEAQQAAQRAAAQAAAQRAAQQQQNSTQQPAPLSSGPALGPSGGWAIPYSIVMCESGGQNLPPNSAGASGYYQIIPATWRGAGGSGPAAYLASKAEQDAVASRLWNGGAGASNWVCAGIVGIH